MSLSYVLPLNVSKGAATLQSILNNNNGSTMGPVAPLASWLASTTNVFQIKSWNSRFANRTSDLLSEMHVLDARGGSGGTLRKRVPAFRALYAVVSGRDWLAFTARAPFAALADGAYELARRHKHRLAVLFPRCEPCAR